MKQTISKKTLTDLLLPLALFFAFTLSAALIILFAARIYRSSVDRRAVNFDAETALSYISEKVHREDARGGIYAGTFDGLDALIMESAIDDTPYVTVIYADAGSLKELYMKQDVTADRNAGTAILSISDFSVTKVNDHLISVRCTDTAGNTREIFLATRTE